MMSGCLDVAMLVALCPRRVNIALSLLSYQEAQLGDTIFLRPQACSFLTPVAGYTVARGAELCPWPQLSPPTFLWVPGPPKNSQAQKW